MIPPASVSIVVMTPGNSNASLHAVFLRNHNLGSSCTVCRSMANGTCRHAVTLNVNVNSNCLFRAAFRHRTASSLANRHNSLVKTVRKLLLTRCRMLHRGKRDPSRTFGRAMRRLARSLVPLFTGGNVS